MTGSQFNVGAFVHGSPRVARELVLHNELFTAYADGEVDDEREAYLSHFVFGEEMRTHYDSHRQSVANYPGPCWCRWIVLDIDRPDLVVALEAARRIVKVVHQHYPEMDGDVPVYFSGGKGFHILIELANNPSPANGFHRVARAYAESLSARAGVQIDNSIYDIARIIRLPNTKHPRTGLFKRRIDSEMLLSSTIDQIREHARSAAGDGLPRVRPCPKNLADDWRQAEEKVARGNEARAVHLAATCREALQRRAPRYLLEFLRFGVNEGERHVTLFWCAAWLTEQGAPPNLCFALLTEPGEDVGLMPRDVERQIQCGIKHSLRQRQGEAEKRKSS